MLENPSEETTLNQLRLSGSHGANRAMEAELKRIASRALGGRLPKPHRADQQTLIYPFDAELAWLAVRYARTPSRVLWDLVRVHANRLEPLHDRLVEAIVTEDPLWLSKDLGFSVEVRRSDSFPAGPLQIRGAVKNALLAASNELKRPLRLAVDDPDLLLRVETDGRSQVTLSLDLAGRSMHRRGERLLVSEASLKETLAAQMLILARWNPRDEGLVDPMAGAGTFVMEAARTAVGAPIWKPPAQPAVGKVRPFRDLPAEMPNLFPGDLPPLAGIEVHTPSYQAFTTNLERAGLRDKLNAWHADFRDVPADRIHERLGSRGLVVVNPPYGERLTRGRGRTEARERRDGAQASPPDLLGLYQDLGNWWRSLGSGWRLAILGPGSELEAALEARPKLEKPMRNGPLFLQFQVYEA